jgi:hypothetical protein
MAIENDNDGDLDTDPYASQEATDNSPEHPQTSSLTQYTSTGAIVWEVDAQV